MYGFEVVPLRIRSETCRFRFLTLKEQALHAFRWNLVGTGFKGLVQLALLIVISRSLSVHDLGVVAAIDVLMAYSLVLADGGFSSALIQHPALDDETVSTAFWISTSIGLFLAVVLFVAAPVVDEFFGTASEAAFRLASLVFVFAGLAQLFSSLLQKSLRFRELSSIEALGATVTLVVTVSSLYFGFGPVSYVYGLIGRFSTEALLKFLATKTHWKIKPIFSVCKAQSIARFGSLQLGEAALDKLAVTADKLFIGPMLGPEALGYYFIANELARKPGIFVSAALGKIAYPLFSLTQLDSRRLQEAYISLSRITLLVLGPLLILMAIYPADSIRLAFGDKWIGAAPIVTVFALLNLLKEIGGLGGKVMLASGRPGLSFTWKVIWVPLLIASCYVGVVRGGVLGLTYYVAVVNASVLPIWHYLIARVAKIDYRCLAQRLAPMTASLIVATVVTSNLPAVNENLRLLLGSVVFMTTFAICLLATDFRETQQMVTLLLFRGRAGGRSKVVAS